MQVPKEGFIYCCAALKLFLHSATPKAKPNLSENMQVAICKERQHFTQNP